jgi:hypothetical protein
MRNNLTRYSVCCCTDVAALRLATSGSAAPVITAPNTSPNTDTSTSSLRMASSSDSDDVTTGSTRVPRSLSASTRKFVDRIVNEDSGLHKHRDLALLEMYRSSVKPNIRPKHSAEYSARLRLGYLHYSAEVRPNIRLRFGHGLQLFGFGRIVKSDIRYISTLYLAP